jgi:alpha-mannosidase
MSLSLEWRHRIMAWRQELTQHFIQPLGTIALEAAFTKDQYQAADALTTLSFAPINPGKLGGQNGNMGGFGVR